MEGDGFLPLSSSHLIYTIITRGPHYHMHSSAVAIIVAQGRVCMTLRPGLPSMCFFPRIMCRLSAVKYYGSGTDHIALPGSPIHILTSFFSCFFFSVEAGEKTYGIPVLLTTMGMFRRPSFQKRMTHRKNCNHAALLPVFFLSFSAAVDGHAMISYCTNVFSKSPFFSQVHV